MTLSEKYESLTSGKRSRHDRVWVTNPQLNELPRHEGNPVLIDIPVKAWQSPRQPYQKQGYVKYVHTPAAPAPAEAKKAAAKKQKAEPEQHPDEHDVHTEE